MKVIGLLGGIASGKSTIAGYLHELGAGVINGDKITHEVLNIPEIVDQMKMRWKDRVTYNCCIDQPVNGGVRKQIAQIVFKDQDELRFLETITWPPMKELMLKRMALYHPEYTPAVVIDFPLLVESGFHYCIQGGVQFWYVDCAPEVRLANFKRRRAVAGIVETDEEAMDTYVAREERQEKLKYKFELGVAGVMIKNDMTPSVKDEVRKAWMRHVCSQGCG